MLTIIIFPFLKSNCCPFLDRKKTRKEESLSTMKLAVVLLVVVAGVASAQKCDCNDAATPLEKLNAAIGEKAGLMAKWGDVSG